MTRSEWVKRAEEHEKKAREFLYNGDEGMAEYYFQKASACRENSLYGREDDGQN